MRSPQQEIHASRIQGVVSVGSLGWLAAANLVGLLLALMLIAPSINSWMAPVTYGRLMPLHMEWQLYGWCAMPLLGLLAIRYWDHNDRGWERTKWAITLWSAALVFGGLYWLVGRASGKPFLNWTGGSRAAFVLVLMAIWFGLFRGWVERGAVRRKFEHGLWKYWADGVVMAGLLVVPVALYITSTASVYPPVNPNSGGATGHSLLASTLAMVALMGLLPGAILSLPKRSDRENEVGSGPDSARRGRIFWSAFAASIVVYLWIEHGDASHHSWDQIVGLASLLVWPPLVIWLWVDFGWSRASRRWRLAFFWWWAALAVNGLATFLPGALELLKFTNALVAHAHLAMGGMVTALNMVILAELGPHARVRRVLGSRRAFWSWNGGMIMYVVSMLWQGVREGLSPQALFLPDHLTDALYGARLAGGLAMTAASLYWIANTVHARSAADSRSVSLINHRKRPCVAKEQRGIATQGRFLHSES